MKVLVIGSGGREHALVRSLVLDPTVTDVWCAPGNGGTGEHATNIDVDASNPAAVAALAQGLGIDLVVVGPEAPLVAGVADAVRAATKLKLGVGQQDSSFGGNGFCSLVHRECETT